MSEILSFFSFKTSLIIVAVLMLFVVLCKIYNLLQVDSADCSFLSLKTTKPWMTFLCRFFFYLGLFVVALTAINFVYQDFQASGTAWWISVFLFCYYGAIGLILQLILMTAIFVALLLLFWIIVIIMECLWPSEAK